jgi:hypothetical protein
MRSCCSKLIQVFVQPAQATGPSEAQRERAEQAGLAAYLAWVQEECGVLPQKPLDEDDEELLLEKVYVPLRVVERDQMERFVARGIGRARPAAGAGRRRTTPQADGPARADARAVSPALLAGGALPGRRGQPPSG